MRYLKLLLIISFVIIFSCEKEDRSKITVLTLPVEFSKDSLIFQGKLSGQGNFVIDKAGFILNPNENSDSSIKLLTEDILSDFSFHKKVFDDFEEDKIYTFQAFIETENSTVLGDKLEFSGRIAKQPIINDFAPKYGYNGNYIKIYGENFGDLSNTTQVLFGEKQAIVEDFNHNRILVKVPDYDFTEYCKIKIIVNGVENESEDEFLLSGPMVYNFSPNGGNGKFTVRLNGDNFENVPWRNVVTIGSQKQEVIKSEADHIIVEVNTNSISPGFYPIKVTTNSKSVYSDSLFQVTSNWKKIESLPTSGISNHVTFGNNNSFYICTGTSDWLNASYRTAQMYEYNTLTSSWIKRPDFPGGSRVGSVGFSIGTNGYIATGLSGSPDYSSKSDFWAYETESNSWFQKPDFPGGSRHDAISFAHNGKGYIGLGTNGNSWKLRVDFWEYDPNTDSWNQLPDFPGHERRNAHCIVLDNKLFIIGGNYSNSPFDPDIWTYDFATMEWSFIDYLSISPIASIVNNNRLFIINATYQKPLQLIEFDPKTNLITNKHEIFPGSERKSGSFIYSTEDKIYFGGGAYGGFGECLNDLWSYTIKE